RPGTKPARPAGGTPRWCCCAADGAGLTALRLAGGTISAVSDMFSAAAKSAGPALSRIVGWVWRWLWPDTAAPALVARANNRAETIFIAETTHLHQLGVIRREAVDVTFDTLTRGRTSPGPSTLSRIGSFYERIPNGRMVILGEPGSGKTVTALHLL